MFFFYTNIKSIVIFFFSSRRRHTRFSRDWSSDVCSSDLLGGVLIFTDVLPLSGAGTGASVALGGLTVLITTAYSVRELRRAERADEIERAKQAKAAEW